MNANSAHWFILILINIPVYLALGKMIFKDWGNFLESVRLWSTVDWWYSLDKQWRDDRKGTAELPLFILLCGLLVVVEHLMFGKGTLVKPAAHVAGLF